MKVCHKYDVYLSVDRNLSVFYSLFSSVQWWEKAK